MSKLGKVGKAFFKPSPRGKLRWAFAGILVLVIIAGLVDYPKYYNQAVDAVNPKMGSMQLPNFPEIPFHLGLDLQGGAHLVYETDLSQIPADDQTEAVEGVRDVIERRVNAFGVSEPVVQTVKSGDDWRIIVELAGITDISEAINEIGETPLLEFKEPNTGQLEPIVDEETDEDQAANQDALRVAQDITNKLATGTVGFDDLVAEYSQDSAEIMEAGGNLGFTSKSSRYGYLFDEAEKLGVGKASSEPFERADSFQVIRVDDSREIEKEIEASHILICFEGANRCERDMTKEEALAKATELKAQATPENFDQLARENSTEPGVEDSGGTLGWFAKGVMVAEFEEAVLAMGVGEISDPVETPFGYHLIHKTDERPVKEYDISRIFIAKAQAVDAGSGDPWLNTALSGKHLRRAQLSFDPNTNEAQVSIEFDSEGKDLFAEITSRNVGQPVAIYLDGELLSAPVVQQEIRGGEAVITGGFTVEEAKLLSQRLNAGALPVPIRLMSQQTVGATLGHESVQRSLLAGLIGLLLVALYMVIVYRLPGLMAVLALMAYIALVLAIFKVALVGAAAFLITLLVLIGAEYFIFKYEESDFDKIVFGIVAVLISIFVYTLLSKHVTMTLAGVAGLLLSVGMAVDANVLIFERFKEEMRSGKPLQSAIDDGFMRAWGSIRDGNVSTLITSFILATFSTSIIKGFAITLSAGIIISMFSAIVITKTLLRLATGNKERGSAWLYGAKARK